MTRWQYILFLATTVWTKHGVFAFWSSPLAMRRLLQQQQSVTRYNSKLIRHSYHRKNRECRQLHSYSNDFEILDATSSSEATSKGANPEQSIKNDVALQAEEAPSVRKILKFAVPAIGVWLCSPLLSLIDTSAVGILSGTIQQAALNPAVAVTDYAALLIAFLYTGTTNLVGVARSSEKFNSKQETSTTSTMIGALQLSGFVGLGLGVSLFFGARILLSAIIGNNEISPEVMEAAMKYVRIRALGMPAAAWIGSAQAACLGLQDIKSPLYVLLAAAVINFCGDFLFVGSNHPWIGGAAGAAWATVFSQYAAVGLFLRWLRHKSKPTCRRRLDLSLSKFNLKKIPFRLLSQNRQIMNEPHDRFGTMASEEPFQKEDYQNANKNFTVKGLLKGKIRKREFMAFPSQKTLAEFAPYVLPVTSTQVGRVSGYVAMSHVVSSAFGTISMAAQQVIVSLFYCLTPVADSLSLTAQSFLPTISAQKPGPRRTEILQKTIFNFWKAGGIFGIVMMAATSCVPFMSGFFTADPLVMTLVNMVSPLLLVFFATHGFMCSSEGLLLGQKDLGFLGKMYAAFFVIVPMFMMRVKHAALSNASNSINILSVWKIFVSYQVVCSLSFMIRVSVLHNREKQRNPLPTS